jgi:glucose-6-phosphate 1-dehydrogenase
MADVLPKRDSKINLVADDTCGYLEESLTIFVVGASGDLAKKKTYPSLFDLFRHDFLAPRTIICGYARSLKTDEEFREQILPYLKGGTDQEKQDFLELCIYRTGNYDSVEQVSKVFEELQQIEKDSRCPKANRLFYFAIPPTVFVPIGKSLKEAVIGPSESDPSVGWNRLIIEKPFGKDSASFQELSSAMSALYSEDYLYRIDH